MYSEYSNGVILLTDYEFERTVTYVDRYTSSVATNVTVNIKATCTNITGYFLLSGVQYTLINGDYDVINHAGTPSVSGNCSINTAYTPVLQETATNNAQIKYRLNFIAGPTGYYTFNSLLTLTVGDNSATVTHVNNT